MKNERGFITLDFIFSLTLILGFAGVLFALTFTLSVASITQYITFAAARNYAAAHLDEQTQIARGQAKYQELISNSVFKPLYANGWYKVDATANIGDHTKVIPGYADAVGSGQDIKNLFWGVGTHFVAPVLDFHIPFFGSTVPDSDGTGSAFTTYMGSYLGREPSAAECLELVSKRWDQIQKLDGAYGSATNVKYYNMADDGC